MSSINPPSAHDPSLVIAISADPSDNTTLLQQAQALAVQLQLPQWKDDAATGGLDVLPPELQLAVTPRRFELRWAEPAEQQQSASRKKSRKPAKAVTGLAIHADWSSLNIASAAGTSIKQPIAKALGLKSIRQEPALRVIDTTAGWGEDAWVMASLGCHVLMIERSPLIAVMLQDALNRERARSPQTVSRLRVINDDATCVLERIAAGQSLIAQHPESLKGSAWDTDAVPDVIHLDPMFPGEKTSAERKPMRLLRRLVGDDPDAGVLFAAARKINVKRVIVKRPPHGPTLGGPADIVISGKASRYDVYVSVVG